MTTEEMMMMTSSSNLFENSSSYSMPLPLSSIEEEEEESTISVSDDDDDDDAESLFSIDFNLSHNNMHNSYKEEEDDDREVCYYYYYYVAVGRKSESSMDALLWTVNHAATHQSSSTSLVNVVIVHVFPPLQFIPSPLGMLPKSKVSPKMVDKYMVQERDRRRKLLQKYVDACSAAKVKVDVMLIESDTVSKAILDLIPTQNIKTLVVGTTNSSMRKLRSKKGSGIANQILRNAPETSCEIRIICKGKEVMDQDHTITRSISSRSSNVNSLSTQEEDDNQELPISPDYNKQGLHYTRPAVKSPSAIPDTTTSAPLVSLNGYKAIWRGKLKPKKQLDFAV
ncbi:hypothetical protein ACE6H2_003357 [Prunus campanulata]